MAAPEAIRQVHFRTIRPTADRARDRFGFEELLYIELGVVRRRKEWQDAGGAPVLALPDEKLDAFLESLPFRLTNAQRAAIDDVLQDTGDETPMTRLLEGDVGSGKTVVARGGADSGGGERLPGRDHGADGDPGGAAHAHVYAHPAAEPPEEGPDGPWFQAAAPGYVVLDAPYMGRPVGVALLTGSLKASEKNAVQAAIASGE